jgi:hypothetical protein
MWLRTVACGLLLFLLHVQGETPAGDDRDQGQICHTVQRHSLRLGAGGLQERRDCSHGLNTNSQFTNNLSWFEEKKIKYSNFQIKRTGRINPLKSMSERKCPPVKGEFRG